MVFFSIMVYKAYGSRALSNSSLVVVLLLVLCNDVCRVYCSCSGPLSTCSCAQYKDTNSQAQLQVCSHSNITAYLNLAVSSLNVRVVAELIYYNQSLEENITVTFPNSVFYDPTMTHFTITLDLPSDSSVTEFTMLFCYENNDFEQFVLNPATCIIETEEQEDPLRTSSDVWWPAPASSSAIMLQDVQSKLIQYTTNSVLSAMTLPSSSPPPPSSWRSEVTNTNSIPSSTVYNWTTDLTTPTIPVNTTTPSDEPVSVTESSSGSSNVATILAVTVCICVTIIIGSLSLSLGIVKYTKYSRKSIISYDDSSSYGGRTSRMDKDIYSSTVSLSSSIITTLAPLAWEQDTPKTTKQHLDNRAALTLDLKDGSSLQCIDSANSDFSTTILYTVDSHLPGRHGNPGIMTTYITTSSSGISSSGDESDTSNNTVNLAMPAVEMDKISEISVTPHSVSSGGSVASSVSLSSLEFKKDDHTNTDGRSGVVSRQQTTVSRCCSKNEENSQETERHTTANNEELNEDPSAVYIVLTNSSKNDVSDRLSGGGKSQRLPVYIHVNNQSPVSEEIHMFSHFQETVV